MLTGVEAAVTTRLSDSLADCALGVVESVTFTVKDVVPTAVGVPLIWPVAEFNAKPFGKLPPKIIHVYGVVPPVAARIVEYTLPNFALGIEVVAICNAEAPAVISIDSDCSAVRGLGIDESVTVATNP
jgi:hypothetical protein